MLDETTTQEKYQPTAEQWTAYRLRCWRDDNNIEQYQPARVVVLSDEEWEQAFEAMAVIKEELR